MRNEKLQCLLSSFIENRQSFDEVDGVLNRPGIVLAECGLSSIQTTEGPGYAYAFEDSHVPSLPFLHSGPPLTPSQSVQAAATGRHLAKIAAEYSYSHPELSEIKFETSCRFVPPEGQVISIHIYRSHSCVNKVTQVTWRTCDKTAFSGIHYIASAGDIVFREGETKKKIKIKILKTDDHVIDLRFTVEVSDVDGGFIPKPMTITLRKTDHFYRDEKKVIENLNNSTFCSVADIKSIISDSLTTRTFHVGLSHLCSIDNAVPVKFALAFELSRLCLYKIRKEAILYILADFFRLDDVDF